ncbi:MAG: DUF262 domain-containing protein [Eubacteriales bacterium]|nr:DUF262 domain-containing protein [Eubacteriales bacterium]
MIAKEGYIVRFLDGSDKKFVIPVYQRPYSWKKSNCELLIKDLLEVYNRGYKSHFFGSIVYVENDIGGCNEYIIIDGQQRITTVSLLLLAIRNYVTDNKLDIGINANKITTAYLTDEYADSAKKLKLKLVQGDDDAYDRLIEKTQPITNNNVTVNYNYFYYDVLSSMQDTEIKGLYDAIMKLMIVNISLNPHNGDDPQLIFESLNSTGLDLEEADKIRNYVLMKMSSTQQERIYKNYWEKLENQVSKEDINRFIRHYLAVKTRELANENKLYFAFKNYREKNIELQIEEILNDILIYAEFYNQIKNAKISDRIPYLNAIARINKLEVNTVIPLLFDLFYAKKQGLLSEEDMSNCVSVIESYIARRIICGLPTSALNKIFVGMGAEIKRYMDKNSTTFIDALKYSILSKTGKSRFPNDHDFAEKFVVYELYNAKPNTRKYFFERLENYNNRERIAVEEQIDNTELTIEHIMPQSLTAEWKESLGDNWELTYSKYIDTVGNLTLTAYNSDYSNLSFAKKKSLPDKGFLYSKLSLNSFIKNCEVWTEKQIKERASKLYEWAEKIWQTPVTSFEPDVIEDWITLDDEIDFTNKTILKINLLGDEIMCDNITDAYKKINVTLYMLDPVLFAGLKNNYHNESSTELRSPYSLSDSMYIETNLSSPHKINIIRELFDGFGFDYQDLKFLVRPKQKDSFAIDLDDEGTYYNVTCGELAYRMFSYLLENNMLPQEEIDKLMTKDFARMTFKKVVYPVLSLSREANRGDSRTFRYYKTPINVNDIDIYISSQWFDESREDLITYFNSKKQCY